MKRLVPLLLLVACALCLLIGCVKQNEPTPAPQPVIVLPAPRPEKPPVQPEPVPVTESPHPHAAWLAVSPMRMKMRSMWMSCGELNAMGSGVFGVVNFDTLESNAGNIARKAKEFGDMWQAVRDTNREMAARAKEEDWFEARYQSQRLRKSCDDCHVENWSLQTRGFLPETVDTWVDNGSPIKDIVYGKLKLSAPPEYLRVMYLQQTYLTRSIEGVENNDKQAVLKTAQSMHGIAAEHVELWRGVERHANKIVEITALSNIEGIDVSYGKMIENCNACHAKYVQDERKPLNPLPWKYRNE